VKALKFYSVQFYRKQQVASAAFVCNHFFFSYLRHLSLLSFCLSVYTLFKFQIIMLDAFSASTLLVGRQEGHPGL